jgi:hypothetical protein
VLNYVHQETEEKKKPTLREGLLNLAQTLMWCGLTSAKIGLIAGNMKFNTQNEK